MKYTRENSMSISEAVENIRKKSKKRKDTCAREFANTLINSNPELMFWQNTPPDIEDLTNKKIILLPELARQTWPLPVKTTGWTIGHWLLDVYAGSNKAVQWGNKWDEPYDFSYEAAFGNDNVPPQVADLPQPLMKNFRADKTIMRSICLAAIESIRPRGRKTENKATKYVDNAAQQVAATLPHGDVMTRSKIINRLRILSEPVSGWRPPITEILFVLAEETESVLGEARGYDLILVRWDDVRTEIKAWPNSLDTFAKKVKDRLN